MCDLARGEADGPARAPDTCVGGSLEATTSPDGLRTAAGSRQDVGSGAKACFHGAAQLEK
jgi:hypothetical protein